MKILLFLGLGLLLAGAFLAPERSGPWISALVLPVTAAAWVLGPRGSWLLAALSFSSTFFLAGWDASGRWLAGSWTSLALVPLLVGMKARRMEARLAACEIRQKELAGFQEALIRQRQEQTLAVRGQDEEISAIVELYGLSKKFLATLDLEEAIRITQEVLETEWQRLPEADRAGVLAQVRKDLERGEVELDRLWASLPNPAGSGDPERFEILKGQLAQGLRRVALYRQVQESATHDSLTGLWVRRHFLERLAEEANRASRRGLKLAFLMVDLDFFKRVNDTYGHLVGDVVLKEAADRLRRSVREVDLVARYGGEEFAVALPEADRLLGVQVADRIRQAMSQTEIPAYDERIGVTVSVGVALFPDDARTTDDLIEAADQAMYRAKASGRNRTVAVPDQL